MPNIQNVISDLKKKYERNYGFAVFDLDWKESGDAIVVSGKVLTEKQKEEALVSIGEACGKKVEDDIRVLGSPSSRGIGWAAVRADVADFKSRFVPTAVMNEKILKRIRASQIKKGEILRVLLQKDDQILAQSGDLTLGWIDLADVDLRKESLEEKWRTGVAAQAGETVVAVFSEEKIIREAEKFLGVRYVLGAKSDASIDCSGFTQAVYKNACGVILPKHSWDQKKMGVAVEMEKAQTGDLVFMVGKETGTKHVGIFESVSDKKNIIHASSASGEVTRQSADEVFEKYNLAEVRRVVKND